MSGERFGLAWSGSVTAPATTGVASSGRRGYGPVWGDLSLWNDALEGLRQASHPESGCLQPLGLHDTVKCRQVIVRWGRTSVVERLVGCQSAPEALQIKLPFHQ